MHRNIFLLQTGNEWQKRRDSFKLSFSNNSLRHFQDVLKELTSKLITKLNERIQKGEAGEAVVEMDVLFGQMTIDVICSLAFNYDVKALDDSEISNELHNWMRTFFELTW